MEDLQALWNKAARAEKEEMDREKFQRIISRKSDNELAKFRKVVKREYISTLLLFPLIAIGGWWLMPDKISYFAFTLFTVGCIFFYQNVIRKIRKVHVEDDLRTYLENALRFIKSYVRQYITISWVGGLLGIYIGYTMGYDSGYKLGQSLAKSDSTAVEWLAQNEWLMDASLAFFVIVCLVGIHLYIKYLYQARIVNLQKLLDQLRED